MTDAELDAVEADLATRFSYRACKWIAEDMIKETRETRRALRLILPMAKGWAAEHQVGNNGAFICIAEDALNRTMPTTPLKRSRPVRDAAWTAARMAQLRDRRDNR